MDVMGKSEVLVCPYCYLKDVKVKLKKLKI